MPSPAQNLASAEELIKLREEHDKSAAEVERLRAENENLRGQLSAAGAPRPNPARHEFTLSEGERQELEITGVVTIGGRQYTTKEVRAELAKNKAYRNVEIKDAPAETRVQPVQPTVLAGVRGIDYVYPSVAPGRIDPAVAGTPGINGPAAATK
jgi:hypothetical protein